MDAFVLIAVIAVVLMLAELLLPTGGLLAGLGAIGLIVAGIVAITADADTAATEYIGPALITLGVLSAVTFYFVTRKVLAAHRDERVRTGAEEMVGSRADVRTTLDPEGQVWAEGALWRARLADGAGPARPGDRVVIEAVDGLTLVVSPQAQTSAQSKEGAG